MDLALSRYVASTTHSLIMSNSNAGPVWRSLWPESRNRRERSEASTRWCTQCFGQELDDDWDESIMYDKTASLRIKMDM
jgi:hypothetical protein